MEASVDGVLGGYGLVNEADVRSSEAFLKTLLVERFGSAGRHLVALGNVSYRLDSVLGLSYRLILFWVLGFLPDDSIRTGARVLFYFF